MVDDARQMTGQIGDVVIHVGNSAESLRCRPGFADVWSSLATGDGKLAVVLWSPLRLNVAVVCVRGPHAGTASVTSDC